MYYTVVLPEKHHPKILFKTWYQNIPRNKVYNMTYNNYYEYEWDSYYCYPNCFISKNKLNIKDENLLDEAERQITAVKILDTKMHPIKGNLNFEHLANIHEYVFEDIYKWAGETRSVNISKGSQFCNHLFINNMAEHKEYSLNI